MSDAHASPTSGLRMISVDHHCEDGWHTFTSKEFPGLFICGQGSELEALYDGLPEVLEALVRADFGQDVVVRSEETFSSYRAMLPQSYLAPVTHYSIASRAA